MDSRTFNLLSQLGKKSINIQLDGDKLRITAPDGALTGELREQLTEHKSEIIEFLRNAKASTHLEPLVHDADGLYEPFGMTDIQQAYWIGRTSDFEMGNISTHMYHEYENTGLDVDRLEAAWQRLIERHAMLRAVIRPDGQQQILKEVPQYKLKRLDLRGADKDYAEKMLNEIRDELSHQLLPSDTWPLFDIRASLLDNDIVRIHISIDLLIADARSCQLLIWEFAQLYLEPDKKLAPLNISFRDYINGASELEKSDLFQRSLEYWKRRAVNLPQGPVLPFAVKPSSIEKPHFVRKSRKIASETWKKIKATSTKHGITPSTVLMTAFAHVLSIWSKNPVFSLNLTLFNRVPRHEDINYIIGDFTSLTLLEIDNSNEIPFIERARLVQKRVWEDLDHRHVSGIRVMREMAQIAGSREGISMPVVFTSEIDSLEQDIFIPGEDEMDVSVMGLGKEIYAISQTPQVWIDHQVFEQRGVLTYNWDVAVDLFPEGLIDNAFEAYYSFILKLAESEDLWNAPSNKIMDKKGGFIEEFFEEAPLSSEMLHTLFLKQVYKHPENTAVVSGDRKLSYEEVYRLSNQLAQALKEKGAEVNKPVAVVLEKSWQQVVGVMGVLLSGAAYLPISSEVPKERLENIIKHAGVSIVVTNSKLKEKSNLSDAETVCVDGKEVSAYTPINLETLQNPGDLAYIIYTSGSTGQPKGVVIDHRGAVNTILDVNSRFGISEKDSVLAVSALGFDLSVYDIFGMLAAGGKIVIPDETDRLDPVKWNELVAKHGVTVWNTVPALMEMFVEHCEGEKTDLPDSLRLVLLSGDWIPLNLPDRIKAGSKDIQVISLGGATEGSIWSILYPIGKVDANWKSIPYGKAMKNQRMLVLDHLLEQRPVWVPGEIYIGGMGVAKGYWMDDQRTKESFITHPVTGEYLYKTGDLGRYLPEGNIEFLGREDTQVKIGGHRIELGEIESVLGSHPGVKNCVVTVVEEGTLRNKRLVAYFIAENDLVEINDLKNYLSEKLPNYMVPTAFHKLSVMPLSANGKVDRKALPDIDVKATDLEKTYVAPRTNFEKGVARILAEEIGYERVGITDNFFELGGDSILAIKFLLRVKQETNVVIPVRMLFENSTIQELASAINLEQDAQNEDVELPVIKSDKKNTHKPFPLTGLQQAYLVGRSDAVAMGNVACHTYEEIDAHEYDLERFERAWNKLIHRHDVLRTVVLHDGMQKVLEDTPEYRVPVLDLRGKPEEMVQKELQNIRERMSHQVIDIHTWPLFEILATKLENGITRLHISIDAMIADAWSVGILTREVSDLYRNEDLEMEPLEISFRDYVVGEHSLKDTEVYKSSLKYWQDRLPDFPPAPQLPLKTNFESIKRPEFVRRRTELDPDTWRRLKANAGKVGITPAGIMLVAFSEILTIWSSLPRFVINVPQFNRLPLHRQVDNLVGEFASFYLLEVNNNEKTNFAERARRVQNQLWQDMNNCYVSGVQVLRELTKTQGGLPNVAMPIVFTSTIGLINHEESSLLEGIGNIVYSISQTPQVWLDCQVGEKGDGLLFNWDSVDELFPDGLLDDMFDAYRNLLDLLAQNPDAWLFEEFRLIPEKQMRVREAANSSTMHVPDVLLHKMFEEAAAAYPDRNAVISSTKTLTYRELNSMTNRLARKLIEFGAQPDKLVVIVMDKGWEQIAAVMAVLKSGAACVPLDADSPAERLLYLIENSQAEIILTQLSLNKTLKWPENKIRLEVDTIDLSGIKEDNLPERQKQESLAYVIYTSGSTGLPKGVMITHKNVVNAVAYTNRELQINCGDKAIHLTPLHHDLAMYDIFGLLAAGGALVIPDASLKKDPKHWLEIMMRENVTFWNTVPAMMEMLVTFVQGREGFVPASLRQVILGGDWIPLYIPDKIRELVPSVRVLSIGGPTETTIWNIWYKVREIDPSWKSIPYGKPIANSKYYILDHMLRDKPCFVSGEMYCSGTQVSKGYWRDEEKTAKSFLIHPSSGELIYKTGDLGRYLPDGNIEFVGRADFQVKLNGIRIELGEIESAITKLPGVKSCIVNVAGEGNAKRLVAYILTEGGEKRQDTGKGGGDSLAESLSSEGIITDPIERLEFKQKHIAIKSFKNKDSVQLTATIRDEASLTPYIDRRSYRNFEKAPILLEDFGKFLSSTSKADFDGMPFPKYRYASAGGLYPLQVFMIVKPDRVEGLQGGAYYYNPYENKLYLVTPFESIDSDIFPPGNSDIYEEAAFAVFLVAELDAIKPMYGSLTNNFCLIEAGIITQLFEAVSIECGMGLCQIGSVDFDRLRPLLELSDSQVYMHCILGGKIDVHADKMDALMKDWGGYKLSLGQKDGGDFVESIKERLASVLPSYMIPSDFMVMNEFPLTANGKVDRSALPLILDTQRQEKNFVAPSTSVEKKLAEILCESLRQENISVLDNLFELGADSLMAIQLISQVRQIFNIELPLKQLFAAPTVQGIAREIELLGGQLDASVQEEFGRFDSNLTQLVNDVENRHEPFPLTDVQQAYWVGRNSFVELGNIATHVYMEMEQKNFDLERFQWAWRQIIQRHEMLRAVVRSDGQQQILEAVPEYVVEVLDLSAISQEEAAAKLNEIRERMSHQVLPADQWPLFEIKATKLRDEKLRLHVSMDLLISDVWSARIISREITQLYLTGESLTPLELSFRDYVIADTKLRKTDVYNKSLEYWRRRLNKLPPAPMLPLAKNPSELTKPRFERRIASIEKERWDKLKNYATAAGITQSGMLVAAYSEILTTWSKNPRFTLNLTLFNRLPFAAQVNEIVGDFTSLILLEIDNSSNESFATRAKRIQDQIWEDLDHRYVSGVTVIRELAKINGGALNAVMPVVFTSTLNLGPSEYPSGSLDSDDIYGISQTPQVWLDQVVSEKDGALVFNWDAVEELFPEHMLDDMFQAYINLLRELADDTEAWKKTRSELVTLPDKDLEVRQDANSAQGDEPEELLHVLFDKAYASNPEKIAVRSGQKLLSYRELYENSNRLARLLRDKGAKPNTLVAVVMKKGWEQVLAVMGILKSGAAYMPVSSDFPSERISYLLKDGEVNIVLTQSWVEARIDWPENVLRICVDRLEDYAAMGADTVEPVQKMDDLAYVIYTSGSTGQPKGVMIDHRGAVNTILDINTRFKVGPEDSILAISALTFDLSVYDIFGLLSAGGTVVMPEPDANRNPERWISLIRLEGITLWNSVPALVEMLTEYVNGCNEKLGDNLRLVLMSGDWIPVSLPEQIRKIAREDIKLISLGGATEASIWSIFHRIREEDGSRKSIPYGKPLKNQKFHVLDENLDPRQVWVPGQLYISGIGLAKGYWKDTLKTEKSFIKHPKTGEILYKTGDNGRYLPDGSIEFLGREDMQVKIQGYRIELGEIEAALNQHPQVQNGVVAITPGAGKKPKLAAYYVPASSNKPAAVNDRVFKKRQSNMEEIMLDPIKRLQFKLRHDGIRSGMESNLVVELSKRENVDAQNSLNVLRRSYRKYAKEIIPMDNFNKLLNCLAGYEIDGVPFRKFHYGSAGNLYPVQVYIYVKPGIIDGVEGGIYYYNPYKHTLCRVSSDAVIDSSKYPPGGNSEVFNSAAFSIFFIGKSKAITPLYSNWSYDFMLLETGLMCQLMEMSGPDYGIGLCQIGSFEFDAIRQMFNLEEDDVYLHCMLGGPIDDKEVGFDSLASEAKHLDALIKIVEMMPQNDDFERYDGTFCDVYKPFIEKDVKQIEDPASRLKFKLSHPGERTSTDGDLVINLEKPSAKEMDRLVTRRSYRNYLADQITLKEMGIFLEAISPHRFDGISMPKYVYASAGSLYPVQTYLYVKKDRVKGLIEGTYYYNPYQHSLMLINEATVDPSLFPQGNGEIFENAGFVIFFVGQINAIAPIYGSWSRDFCILETGLITQALEMTCCDSGIGLCQIGGFDFDKVKHLFDLDNGHFYIHCIAGGKISEGMKDIAALRDDSAGQAKLIELINSSTNDFDAESIFVSAQAGDFANYDTALIEKDIKNFLGRKLPDYMVPSIFVKLDSIPLSSNGKIDRNALSAISTHETVDEEGDDVVPQSELESRIVDVWKEILEVDSININDSFFELGGNSVHLVRAYNKLKEVIGYDLPIATLFEYPTIRSLCKYLSTKGDNSAAASDEDRGELRKASRSRRRNSRDLQ